VPSPFATAAAIIEMPETPGIKIRRHPSLFSKKKAGNADLFPLA